MDDNTAYYFLLVCIILIIAAMCIFGYFYHNDKSIIKESIDDLTDHIINFETDQNKFIKSNADSLDLKQTENVNNVEAQVKLNKVVVDEEIKVLKEDALKQVMTGKLQLGNKFSLSGVGDGHQNDEWLRVMNKDGKDYYGGVATGKLWSRDAAFLNGQTQINGNIEVFGNQVIHKGDLSVGGKTFMKKIQLGDKWQLSGVGDGHNNDDWLRVMNKDGGDYYGGVAAGRLWSRDKTELWGEALIQGAKSEHNPDLWPSHFRPDRNFIRGDTEFRGNNYNIGDLGVGRNLNINNNLCIKDVCINRDTLKKVIEK